MPENEAIDLAARAVRAACEVTRALQDDLSRTRDAHAKADESPVTIADFAAQAVIGTFLGEPFVGEEGAALLLESPGLRERVLEAARRALPGLDEAQLVEAIQLGEASPSGDGFWTLDPVDGTKGFLRGGHYCVCLARIEAGTPRVAAVGCPRLGPSPGEVDGPGALILAERDRAGEPGRGRVFIAPLDDPTSRAAVLTPERPLDRSRIRITESVDPSHSDLELGPRLLRQAGLEAEEPLRLDSQVKYVVVARGDAHAYLRRPREGYADSIWDHAGGSLVAELAGARVTDLDGRPLDFRWGRRLEKNRGVLVAPPALHARLLEAMRQLEDAS